MSTTFTRVTILVAAAATLSGCGVAVRTPAAVATPVAAPVGVSTNAGFNAFVAGFKARAVAAGIVVLALALVITAAVLWRSRLPEIDSITPVLGRIGARLRRR